MKKIIFFGILAFLNVNFLHAQPNKRTSAWNYYLDRQYAKAKEAIDEAAANELTLMDPKTWYFRGLIYLAIANSNDSILKSSISDILDETFISIKKSKEYDLKKRYVSDNNLVLKELSFLLYNDGTDNYNKGIVYLGKDTQLSRNYFQKALKRFEQFIEGFSMMGKDSMSVVLELARYQVDAKNVYLYAANCADQIGNKNRAISLFQGLVNAKYQGFDAYAKLADLYLERGDTNKAFAVIDKGKKNNIDKNILKNLTLKELQLYQQTGKMEELKLKLENALKEEPENVTFIVTLGETYYTISEKLFEQKNINEADEYWKKAMDLFLSALQKTKDEEKEMKYLLNNKIGTVYYNKGADYYNQSIDKANEKREAELKKLCFEYFDLAIPYLEKSFELNPSDKSVIPLLIKIYLLKGDMNKVQELNKLK